MLSAELRKGDNENMKIRMANNLIAILPREGWQILKGPFKAEECKYAGFVEITNYRMPNKFAFFYPKPINSMSRTEQQVIYDAVRKVWPDFAKYELMQRYAWRDANNDLVIEDCNAKAPVICIDEFFDMTDNDERFVNEESIWKAYFWHETNSGLPAIICKENGPHTIIKEDDEPNENDEHIYEDEAKWSNIDDTLGPVISHIMNKEKREVAERTAAIW